MADKDDECTDCSHPCEDGYTLCSCCLRGVCPGLRAELRALRDTTPSETEDVLTEGERASVEHLREWLGKQRHSTATLTALQFLKYLDRLAPAKEAASDD